MKKFIKITLIIIVVLVAVIILLPIVFKGKIIDAVKEEANNTPKCQAFTSTGQLLTDLHDVTTWNYNNAVVSYIKLPLLPPVQEKNFQIHPNPQSLNMLPWTDNNIQKIFLCLFDY